MVSFSSPGMFERTFAHEPDARPTINMRFGAGLIAPTPNARMMPFLSHFSDVLNFPSYAPPP